MIKPEWEKGGKMTTLDMLSGDTWTDITTTAVSVGSLGNKKLSDAIFMSAEVLLSSSGLSIDGMIDSFILQGSVYKANASGTTFRMSGEMNVAEQSSSAYHTIKGKVSLNLALTSNNLQVSIKEIAGVVTKSTTSTYYQFNEGQLKIRNIRLIFN